MPLIPNLSAYKSPLSETGLLDPGKKVVDSPGQPTLTPNPPTINFRNEVVNVLRIKRGLWGVSSVFGVYGSPVSVLRRGGAGGS